MHNLGNTHEAKARESSLNHILSYKYSETTHKERECSNHKEKLAR
ncbi:hypothetical protein HMPREF9071_0506 [Capnocytophaga sp. oral taxon 338 str. F0234]|nr:hypothetical protein HMPREF9071_0506 [Capnocytophaga sp. oral taxon 338 str. F0234]